MTTAGEYLEDGPIAAAIAFHDDDKHGFREYVASAPRCSQCSKAHASHEVSGVAMCEHCFDCYQDARR